METANLHPLEEALGLRLSEIAERQWDKPSRRKESSPRQHLFSPVTTEHCSFNPRLKQEALNLASSIRAGPSGINGIQKNHVRLQGMKEMLRK